MTPEASLRETQSARADLQAAAMRRLWADVALAVLNDYWHACGKIRANRAKIRADALRYFSSSDGREVVSLAGLDASPEQMADAAVDPESRARTLRAGGDA